ncbi:hypothetical protein J6P92_00355 [bacterium]|nr:hypothetical protein [bacterium]
MEKQKNLKCIISLAICTILTTALPALSNNFAMVNNPAAMSSKSFGVGEIAGLKDGVMSDLNRMTAADAVIKTGTLTKPNGTDSNGFTCIVPPVTFVEPDNVIKTEGAKENLRIDDRLVKFDNSILINDFRNPNNADITGYAGTKLTIRDGVILVKTGNISFGESQKENPENVPSAKQEDNLQDYNVQKSRQEESKLEKFQNSRTVIEENGNHKKRVIFEEDELLYSDTQANNRKDEYDKNRS